MISDVQKLNTGRFLLNESVIISELDFQADGVNYKLDYDESMVTEKEASDIGDAFVKKSLDVVITELNAVDNS